MKRLSWSLVALAVLAVACSKPSVAPPPPAPAAPVIPPAPPPPPPPPEVPIGETLQKIQTMEQALRFTLPDMEDTVNKSSTGAVRFAIWAMKRMTLADVKVAKNETTFALAAKDSDEARGKRMCVSGGIIQIAVSKTEFGKFNEGLLMTDSGNLYKYLAAGSSGDLVAHSRARLCGVITGRYEYSNSGGGTGHALSIVGMFDLPQNR